jgi:hypothetical protein
MNVEDFPRIGHLYQHYKGSEYMVLLLGKDEATQTDVVVYSELEKKQVWVRPLEEFCPPRFVVAPPKPPVPLDDRNSTLLPDGSRLYPKQKQPEIDRNARLIASRTPAHP